MAGYIRGEFNMWADYNDKIIDNILINVEKSRNVPYVCEVCNNKTVHLYMHIYNDATKRGALWIWCSSCHSFWHSSVYVPSGWKNCSLIEKDKLCALPIYLDNIKAEIDNHTNKLIDEGVLVFGDIF